MPAGTRPRSWVMKPPHSHRVRDGHPLAQGLVGAWVPNEGTGPVLDRSLHMNTQAFVLNGNAAWTNAKYGRGITFDGSGDYLELPSNVGLLDVERTDAFSTACLVFRSTNTSYDSLFAKGAGAATTLQGIGLGLIEPNTSFAYAANTVIIDLFNDFSTNNYIRVRGGAVPSGVWTHVVITYDGTSTGAGFKLYINGVPQTITIVQDALSGTIKTTPGTIWRFGTNSAGTNEFIGRLDHAYMWRRIITATEAQQLSGDPFAMFSPPAPRMFYFSLVPSTAATITATMLLDGGGTLAATATVEHPATTVLSGGGVLAATATVEHPATATLNGGGTFAATATVTHPATTVLDGGGVLAVNATPTTPGAALTVLDGGGVLAASATVTHGVATLLAGGGTLTVGATVARAATAVLAGGGVLHVTAMPAITRTLPRQASVTVAARKRSAEVTLG